MIIYLKFIALNLNPFSFVLHKQSLKARFLINIRQIIYKISFHKIIIFALEHARIQNNTTDFYLFHHFGTASAYYGE